MLSRNLIVLAKYNLFTISTTTYMSTCEPMQGRNVPSKPFTCLVPLARQTSFGYLGVTVNVCARSLKRPSGVSPPPNHAMLELGCIPPYLFRQEGNNLERNVPTEPRLHP